MDILLHHVCQTRDLNALQAKIIQRLGIKNPIAEHQPKPVQIAESRVGIPLKQRRFRRVATKNRFTDLIEVNISNLAAVQLEIKVDWVN